MKRVIAMSFTYDPVSGQGYATFVLEGENKPRNTHWMPATYFAGLVTMHETSDELFFDGKLFTNSGKHDPDIPKDHLAGLLPKTP